MQPISGSEVIDMAKRAKEIEYKEEVLRSILDKRRLHIRKLFGIEPPDFTKHIKMSQLCMKKARQDQMDKSMKLIDKISEKLEDARDEWLFVKEEQRKDNREKWEDRGLLLDLMDEIIDVMVKKVEKILRIRTVSLQDSMMN